jgi:UDP-N-acetylmuramoyl-L-alanyl-D-glutamate--2,6-diaminopimelate ligase
VTLAELHGVLRAHGLLREDASVTGAIAGGSTPVTGVAYDSRAVEPGAVFVALKGQRIDGTEYARQAIERGAIAIVAEQTVPSNTPGAPSLPWIVVVDARLALAVMAAAFYANPSAEMQVVGITGTNGKTTVAHLIASIFEAVGIRCGLLGTVAYRIGETTLEATRTTPEAPDVQRLLREMVAAGCGACAMEVSSHALSLRRVDGMTFAAGVFTNLTRDHLDFHLDMERYFQAKRRLFDLLPGDAPSALNVDDPRGVALADSVGRPVTYAISLVFVRRVELRRPHAPWNRAGAFEAGGPAQRLQHPRGGGDSHGAGSAC